MKTLPWFLWAVLTALPLHAQHAQHAQHGPARADGPRSADYSDGYTYIDMAGMDMRARPLRAMVNVRRLEQGQSRYGASQALAANAWLGTDADKLWLALEGEATDAGAEARLEAAWMQPLNAWWETHLGVRRDVGPGPDRTWVAFGVQGLAPYGVDVEASGYVGAGGRSAVRLEAAYEWRLTQRWMLAAQVELAAYDRRDRRRGVGAGLARLEGGLRLRYRARRRFAPYVGLAWEHRFGATAALARAAGEAASTARWVAGLRFWF